MDFKTIIVGVGAVALTGSAFAKEYVLKPKYTPGARHVIQMDTDMKMNVMGQNMAMNIGMSMGQNVAAHVEGAEVKFSFERILMNMDVMGKNVAYDSNEEKQVSPFGQQMDISLRPLLKAKMSVVMDKDGNALQVEGGNVDPALQQMGVDPKDMVESINQQIKMLPKKPVSVGETWEAVIQVPLGKGNKAETKLKMAFDSLETINGKDVANLSFKGSFSGDMEENGMKMTVECKDYAGTTKFNIDEGLFQESQAKMKMDIDMGGKGKATSDVKMKMTVEERKKALR